MVAVSIRTDTFSRLETECSVSGTLCALAIDEEEGLNAGTCVVVLVVDLVGETRNPANLESGIEECVLRTGLTETTDEVVSLFTDALIVDVDLIGTALIFRDRKGSGWNWGSGGKDAVAIVENVSSNAFTGLRIGIVDRVRRTATTLTVHLVEP